MKKYFLKESGEELKFGDMLVLDFYNCDGAVCDHMEVKFTPDRVKILTVGNVIEEKNVPDFKGINFGELKKHTGKSKIEAKFEELENRITELEGLVAELRDE